MALMTVKTRMWIDPPQGYLYGFPKIYEPEKHGSLNNWLIHNGYPEKEVKNGELYVRSWPVNEEDDGIRSFK